jgi:hopanoid biosynthesis associated protein HpnK
VNFRKDFINRSTRSDGCRLIVNADDFGLSTEVNEGILEAFEQGILTSTSLIPTGEAFRHAVEIARKTPSLDVGIHLTLTGEKSVLEKNEIPTLVDEKGNFRRSVYPFFSDYIRNRISMEDVRNEYSAQFDKVIDHGISISHIDSHQHLHVLPKILEITIQLANRHGIRAIRFPKERIRIQHLATGSNYPRLIQQIVLNIFCAYSRERMKHYATDHFHGFYYGGDLDKNNLKRILVEQLDNGIVEIMCHPGRIIDGKTMEKYSHWNYQWDNELEGLVDPDVINIVRESNITLSSFKGKYKYI